MTGFDIKQKIDENNRLIEQMLSPNIFTLNNTVAKLLRENDSLQELCKHEFENGYCKYCYRGETD